MNAHSSLHSYMCQTEISHLILSRARRSKKPICPRLAVAMARRDAGRTAFMRSERPRRTMADFRWRGVAERSRSLESRLRRSALSVLRCDRCSICYPVRCPVKRSGLLDLSLRRQSGIAGEGVFVDAPEKVRPTEGRERPARSSATRGTCLRNIKRLRHRPSRPNRPSPAQLGRSTGPGAMQVYKRCIIPSLLARDKPPNRQRLHEFDNRR